MKRGKPRTFICERTEESGARCPGRLQSGHTKNRGSKIEGTRREKSLSSRNSVAPLGSLIEGEMKLQRVSHCRKAAQAGGVAGRRRGKIANAWRRESGATCESEEQRGWLASVFEGRKKAEVGGGMEAACPRRDHARDKGTVLTRGWEETARSDRKTVYTKLGGFIKKST